MPNPIPPTWNHNEYCHYNKKSGHKTDNCFCLKHEIQDLINNGTLPNPNIITKPNISKNLLLDYHKAPPPYQNCVQIDEIEWDCLKLIETTNVNINAMEFQGIRDEEDEVLKEGGSGMGNTSQRSDKIKEKGLEG